jgi:ATP-dependent Clp protease ATP-binding subunit ClpA
VHIEHILLGLLGTSAGIASVVLQKNGLNEKEVREQLEKQTYSESLSHDHDFELNIKAEKIINSALQIAEGRQQQFIDTEHLLLAILSEKSWRVRDVLDRFGVEAERLRSDIDEETKFRSVSGEATEEGTADSPRRKVRPISPTAEYSWPSVTPQFGQFRDSAIRVVMLAQEEARRLGHNYVGSEQLLLGIVADTGIAGKQLSDQQVTLAEARKVVEKQIGRGSGFVAVEIPFTPRAKQILVQARNQAYANGANMIDAEHILLALLDQREGISVCILQGLNVSVEKLRQNVLNALKMPVEGKE